MEPIERCGKKIHIAQEAGLRAKLADRDYLDCEIVGPAVLWLGQSVIEEDCSFADGVEDTLLPCDRPLKGMIWLSKVAFVRCRFRGVGIAGPQHHLNKFLWEPTLK
jgi:hypothetical protein